MAIIVATGNGNWSSPVVWSGGAIPTTGDVVWLNGRTITIDTNVTCSLITSLSSSGTSITSAVTINPNLTLNCDIAGTGLLANQNLFTTTLNNGQYLNINGTIYGGGGGGAGNTLNFAGNNGVLNISGNIIPGINSYALNCTNNFGTLNINGDISRDSLIAGSIIINSTTYANITGNVFSCGSSTVYNIGISAANSIVNIYGNVIGNSRGGWNIGSTSTSTVNIYGNILPHFTAGFHGLSFSTAAGTGNVFGDIYGSNNSTTSYGVLLNIGGAVLNVSGTCYGGDLSPAVVNNTSATVRAKRAKGNRFGPGGATSTSVPGITSVQNSMTYIEELECGENGQFPVSGPVFLTDKSTNVFVMDVYQSTTRTLVDSSGVYGTVPANSDVRRGVVYNLGNNSGTCDMPNPNSVVYGVLTDDTTGSGLVSPIAVWNALYSAIGTSGSIGERLKNCSTVATLGKQLEGSL